MRTHGPARGASMRPDVDQVLGRGEMVQAGCSPAELPFFRDWCRQRLPPLYFRMDEPVARSGYLLEHVETYAKELAKVAPDRAQRMEVSILAAKEAHRLHVAVLKKHRLKHLPTMPDLRTTGSTPTTVEDEEAGRTEQEAWNPAWGDPDALDDLPAPRPQGMRRLPTQDTPIEAQPMRRKPGRPVSSNSPKNVARRESRGKVTGQPGSRPPGPAA